MTRLPEQPPECAVLRRALAATAPQGEPAHRKRKERHKDKEHKKEKRKKGKHKHRQKDENA